MTGRPLLAFVGGFLGAGKTTLIAKAASVLLARGQRVAVVTNDQDSGLVDSAYLRAQNLPVSEVSGGCFCCRFSDLLAGATQLASYNPHVIFAEPVGSCADLSATILQPLLADHRQTFRLAPLSVLVDPATLHAWKSGELPAASAFLFQAQLEEADLLCLTKQDGQAYASDSALPFDFRLSAQSGEGVEEWLAEIEDSTRVVGSQLLTIDYESYAQAEAAHGWLNLHAEAELWPPLSPVAVIGPLLDDLERQLLSRSIPLMHLKMFDRASSGWVKAAITYSHHEPVPEGDLLAGPAVQHEFSLNLRAAADPEQLRELVESALKLLGGKVRVRYLSAFRPAPPVPEHRFTAHAS